MGDTHTHTDRHRKVVQYSAEAESAIHITADDTSLGASQPSKASSQLKTIDLKTGDWSTFTFLWSYNNYGTTIIMVLS